MDELSTLLIKLPASKADGNDGVLDVHLKNLPHEGVEYVRKLFNAILRQWRFPTVWRHAIIVPVRKPGKDWSKLETYRPISFLPMLSKVLQKFLIVRIQAHLNILKLISAFQFQEEAPYHIADYELRSLSAKESTAK